MSGEGQKEASGRPPARWCIWSKAYGWVERAQAFDDHREGLRLKASDQKYRELVEMRQEFEFKQQLKLQARVEWLEEILDKVGKLPLTNIEQLKPNPDGTMTVNRIQGMQLSHLAAALREYREMIATTVYGHIRLSKSMRLQPEGSSSNGVDTGQAEFILGRDPEQPVTTERSRDLPVG
jgi:hypothetical protein